MPLRTGDALLRAVIVHPHLFVRGGGERLTSILVKGLKEMGDEVAVVTSSTQGGFEGLEKADKKFLIGEPKAKDNALARLASLASTILECVKEFEPHSLVSMTEDTVNLAIGKLARPNAKAIQYVHFPVEEEVMVTSENYVKYYRFPWWFNRVFLGITDKIVCNSKYTSSAVKKYWGRDADVIYPAIDRKFMEEPDNVGQPRENIILCSGRFTRLKRQDFLITVFKKVKEEVKDAKLILAGYRDERHAGFLKGLMEEDVEGVEFVINPSDDRMKALYSCAKVYCHPRIAEHFGLTPLEAMSQGVPVVAYDKGGISETIEHGLNGYLAKDDEEFLSYTLKVLKLKKYEWLSFQKKAIKRAKIFSPDSFISKLRKIMVGDHE